MIDLSPYAARVIQRINFLGTWIAVVICVRNFMVCQAQYNRSKGKIHLANMCQVTVIFFHRILYGIIPLFEITTCDYFPLLISLWHLAYILFYIVMFQRLIILEADRHSRWIKVVGLLLIAVRFADWPYEITAFELNKNEDANLSIFAGESCWARWQIGVLILNFIGDAIANLFLSGMFVRRLYRHIRSTQSSTPQNQMIEYIARKSLTCLILTFFVNLAMNLLKVTTFIGEYSDAFTVYFQLAESTLLVEALRVDDQLKATVGCSQCGKSSGGFNSRHGQSPSQKRSILPFQSFDFVPLEERRSGGDPFRNNSSSASSSNHYHHHSATDHTASENHITSTTSNATGRHVTYNQDDMIKMRSPSDPPVMTPTSNMNKASMDITSDYSSRTVVAREEDNFMSSPVAFSRQKSTRTTSPTNPSLPPEAVQPSRSASSSSLPSTEIARPLDTLSRSLVHHPEWNNNDYRMF